MAWKLSEAEAEVLLPILRELPEAAQVAYLEYLMRVEAGETPHDAAVGMFVSLGASPADAFARAEAAVRVLARH
jgi:hypothetical protein